MCCSYVWTVCRLSPVLYFMLECRHLRLVPPLFDVTSYIRGVPPCIFLRASRLVFLVLENLARLCSALLCFALLARFVSPLIEELRSLIEEDGSHGGTKAACFPSVSRPICLVSAYYGPNEARALLLLSLVSRRFLGVFPHQTSDKSCFRGFSGITAVSQKNIRGFGLGVRRTGSERRLFPFRGFVRIVTPAQSSFLWWCSTTTTTTTSSVTTTS